MNQMNDFFPWDEKAALDEWPSGTYRVRVIHAEDGLGSQSGKRMPRVGFQCIEPAEYASLTHFENYTMGSDEAPTDIVKGTFGYRNFMKLLMAAQIPQASSLAQTLMSLKDAELLVQMSYKPAGDFTNNINGYFRLGSRPVGIIAGRPMPGGLSSAPAASGPQMGAPAPGMAGGPPPVGATGPAPPPVAPVAAPVTQPNVVAAPATQTAAMPQTQPAPPVQVPPVAAPGSPAPVNAAPQTGTAPATPPTTPAPAAASGGEPVMRCTLCQADVPVSQFGAHVQSHAQAA